MNKANFIENIQAACKKTVCDLVIKNISIINLFTEECFISDVAIKNGYIVGIGNYDCEKIIDGTNKFICPGLIDAHAHIESSLTTPKEYAKAALVHGITSLIADPHEIANVLGTKGIELILNLSNSLPFNFYFMLPSCVPATPFENSGSILTSSDLKSFYSKDNVLGLAEVMDYPSVINANDDMISKLLTAINEGKIIDGHGAGLSIDTINAYSTANIKTDHECHLVEEALEKLRRGMYVFIREGTVAKNLTELIKLTNSKTTRRLCFCTDDKHIDDLIKNGSIDSSIRAATSIHGVNILTAISMATLNVAECYKINNLGAIAPGYKADFLILDDLNNFTINKVFKDGNLVVNNGKLVDETMFNQNKMPSFENTVNLPKLTKDSFKIDLKGKEILNVIGINANKLESSHLKFSIEELSLKNDFNYCEKEDLVKVAVIERHNNTGNIGLGIINGLNLKDATIATTIAHDSHNLIVCGTDDNDMLLAAKALEKIGGGIVIVSSGNILASVKLEIAGLMSNRNINELLSDLENLHTIVSNMWPKINFNPFLTLSFLSLPVIPELKITDKGLFDVLNSTFIPVVE